MMKNRFLSIAVVVLFLCLEFVSVVHAQDGDDVLRIKLNKNFGYSGLGGDIQGTFTIVPKSDVVFERVEYYLDDEVMGTVASEPFKYKFMTDSYEMGVHAIHAIGYDRNGTSYRSNEIRTQFVTASEGWKKALTILIPILVLSFVMIAVSSFVSGKKSGSGNQDLYGILGASICPKCGRAFRRHWWKVNLVGGSLERCPYCGRWSLVTRASAADIAAAEARVEIEQTEVSSSENQQEALNRSIRDSRYFDE